MPSLKKIAVLTTASIAAVTLAACGQDSGSAMPKQQSVLALLASDIAGSLNKTVETTGKANSVAVKMTGTAGGEKVDASGVISLGDPVKAEMTVNDPKEGPTVVRMIGGTFYVEIPATQRASMGGKKWLKMDLSAMGADGEAMSRQLEDMDPVKAVKTMLAGKDVTVVGEETVDGVRTVHYTTTATVDAYLGQLDAKQREAVSKQMAKAGVTEVKSDVWVDEKYQPRQVRMEMGSMGKFDISYTDFGKPVSVDAPPAAETMNFADMMKQLQHAASGS